VRASGQRWLVGSHLFEFLDGSRLAHREQARDLLMDDFRLRFETWAGAGAPPTPPDR
jgi:hypothetical protein